MNGAKICKGGLKLIYLYLFCCNYEEEEMLKFGKIDETMTKFMRGMLERLRQRTKNVRETTWSPIF